MAVFGRGVQRELSPSWRSDEIYELDAQASDYVSARNHSLARRARNLALQRRRLANDLRDWRGAQIGARKSPYSEVVLAT